MKTKLTLRASIRAYGGLREKGECCNLGAACRTYQDLRFSDADKGLPVLEKGLKALRKKQGVIVGIFGAALSEVLLALVLLF